MCLELMQKHIKKFAPGLFPLVTGRALWPRRENPYSYFYSDFDDTLGLADFGKLLNFLNIRLIFSQGRA